jgi:hypothetical protein
MSSTRRSTAGNGFDQSHCLEDFDQMLRGRYSQHQFAAGNAGYAPIGGEEESRQECGRSAGRNDAGLVAGRWAVDRWAVGREVPPTETRPEPMQLMASLPTCYEALVEPMATSTQNPSGYDAAEAALGTSTNTARKAKKAKRLVGF